MSTRPTHTKTPPTSRNVVVSFFRVGPPKEAKPHGRSFHLLSGPLGQHSSVELQSLPRSQDHVQHGEAHPHLRRRGSPWGHLLGEPSCSRQDGDAHFSHHGQCPFGLLLLRRA